MFNFEKRISEITPEAAYLADPIKVNNRMMVKDLHTMSMNIPWLDILKAAYNDAQMTEETEIIVVSPQYVADIAVIMSTTGSNPFLFSEQRSIDIKCLVCVIHSV